MSASPNPARTEIPVNVDVQRLKDAATSAECHEEVSRGGELQPCEKPAVAVRIDPNEGWPYPVCARHARADMVPLSDVAALLAEVGEVTALRQQVENLRESAETAVFVANNMSESWRIERDRREELSLHEPALRCDLERAEAERDVLRDELEELREATFPKSWAGFKAFIDEVYSDDIFPDDDRDLGPQFVVAARRLTEATLERDALQARVTRAETALADVLKVHYAVEWQECGDDGTPDLGKPLPPFCAECSPHDYVAAIEYGDTIDAAASSNTRARPFVLLPVEAPMSELRDVEAIRADLALAAEPTTLADALSAEAAARGSARLRLAADVEPLLAALADRDAKLAAVERLAEQYDSMGRLTDALFIRTRLSLSVPTSPQTAKD